MGLIRAAVDSASSVLRDQWKEYFYCESLAGDVLMKKAEHRGKGSDNIISNGSAIAVADGQCMLIVEQGKVVEVCSEPGVFTYDMSSEPSVFAGHFGDAVEAAIRTAVRRFTFAGATANDQRVYYLNTKELTGWKFGTARPIPYRVVDERAGIDMDVGVTGFGEYSVKIVDPLAFYTNVAGNVTDEFHAYELEHQMRSEILSALQVGFGRLSAWGIRYSMLTGHVTELTEAVRDALEEKWEVGRGIELVSIALSSVKADEEDERTIKELQRLAALSDPNLAAAKLVDAQAKAMEAAAKNSAGAMVGFAGLNMAGGAGVNAAELFAIGKNLKWDCVCGKRGNGGKFCPECGKPRPE